MVPWTGIQLWEKVWLWGTSLLHDARWEIVRHCRFPSLEQVCGVAADLRVPRQAHEDDRENRMTTWKFGFLRIARPHAIGARWLTMKKKSWCSVRMAHNSHRCASARARRLGCRSSRCTIWLRSQPGNSLKPPSGEHIPATSECTVNELNGEPFQKCV